MSNSLTGVNHVISLDQAIKMTAAYRAQKLMPQAETFDRAALDQLLALPGCAGIRIYHGLDDLGAKHAIIVAVDSR